MDRLRAIAGIVAPSTVIAALMYYFGYVTSYARFAYFGVDLTTLHLSTQELALQSVAALYVPVAALLTAGLFGYLLHAGVRRALGVRRLQQPIRWSGLGLALIGTILIGRALVGVVDTDVAANEPIGLTPLSLGLGPLLVAWGRQVALGAADRPQERERATARTGWLFVVGIGVLSLFWTTNSVAGAYGTGQAQRISEHLT
jgi:hypothetical protein